MSVLILRTCNHDMTAYGGFTWPAKGRVTAPDWDPNSEIKCGKGLHGLLWGEGSCGLLNWSPDAKWLVVKVAKYIPSGGKVRFRSGTVVHCGDQKSATEFIAANGGAGRAIAGFHATAGNGGTATAGNGGTATAGEWGTATAGDWGTIQIKRWDGRRYRIVTGYIGEDGRKPNTPYRLDEHGKFIEANTEK